MIKPFFKIKWSLRNLFVFLIAPFLRNKNIEDINIFEQRFYSQNGEDGIIKIIFDKIGITNKFCVEFGVGDGGECNTRYLVEAGWSFLHMDCNVCSDLSIKKEFVTAENVNFLFKKYAVPEEFDLLSIDVDLNDYWIWKAISGYSPRVVVIEYNASISPAESLAVEYDPSAHWDGTNYFGASLLALAKLGTKKGYALVGCDSAGVNAFFVRDYLIEDKFEIKSIEQLYKRPRYGEKFNGKYLGHPSSQRSMIPV